MHDANTGSKRRPVRPQLSFWRRLRRQLSGMWQELIALVLLFSAEFTACTTLWMFDGQPVQNWPLSITVGTLIAAYSAILRMAAAFLLAEGLARLKWYWYHTGARPLHDLVLFDDATRGPWGAFCLLRKLNCSAPWQSLGCILVLLLLLVGPFEQEMLQYIPCSANVTTANGAASIARTAVFLGQGYPMARDPGFALSTDELSSVNAGLFSPSLVSPVCNTISCAYGVYSSVGYHGRCEDISDKVEFRLDGKNSSICLPSGLCNTYHAGTPPRNGIGPMLEDVVTAGLTTNLEDGFDMTGHQSFEVLMGLPRGPFDPLTQKCSDNSTGMWRCRGYAAASCAMLPCINTYSGKVINGSFHETLLGYELDALDALDLEGSTWLSNRSVRAAIHLSRLNGSEWELFQHNRTGGLELKGGAKWLPYKLSDNASSAQSSLEKSLLNQGKLFVVDADFHRALTAYIGFSFSGTLSSAPDGHDRFKPGSGSGNGLLRTIYNYGNFSLERTQEIFSNMSISLTTHMRQNAGIVHDLGLSNASLPQLGVSQVGTTCVHIRWQWWAVPGSVAVLTLTFYASVLWLTMLSKRRMSHAVRSWKSSPLPLLFDEPHKPVIPAVQVQAAATNESQHVDDLKTLANAISVNLREDGEGTMRLQRS